MKERFTEHIGVNPLPPPFNVALGANPSAGTAEMIVAEILTDKLTNISRTFTIHVSATTTSSTILTGFATLDDPSVLTAIKNNPHTPPLLSTALTSNDSRWEYLTSETIPKNLYALSLHQLLTDYTRFPLSSPHTVPPLLTPHRFLSRNPSQPRLRHLPY